VTDDLSNASPTPAVPGAVLPPPNPGLQLRALWIAVAVLGALCVASVVLAWKADQRGSSLEQELVRRQQDNSGKVAEARALSKQAQENASDTAAKVALLEARVAEVAVQRGQLEDLIQSLSRSRDENVLVDIEAAIRVALQQTAITGSAEPLVATLKQSDERLARYSQPRLEGVRRAIVRDLERVKATSVADIASLGIKLDEAIRVVDDLPLLGTADARSVKEPVRPAAAAKPVVAAKPASAASAPTGWGGPMLDTWNAVGEKVWSEAKSLIRVTRIEHPEAMLLAPEQSFFVRENLKLRLLNARLALLSRQFDTSQADLQAALVTLDRYFDRSSKRTVLATELIRQVAGQARQVVVPRPDDTLAALTAAAAGR
jgi:uroporphyrin-3 C-methyltransferase